MNERHFPLHVHLKTNDPDTRFAGAIHLGAGMQLFMFVMLMTLSILSFVMSTALGVLASFVSVLMLSIYVPAALPALLISAFLFQNTFIALFSPAFSTNAEFEAVRAINFVWLVTAFGAVLLASFLTPQRLPLTARPWLKAALLVLGIVIFYFCLGIVLGDPRDSLVYFRNTITPVACLYIGMVIAGQYRADLRQVVTVLGLTAIGFGYCELFFTFDFLGLFNGDKYSAIKRLSQINSGYWEKVMRETGFVVQGLSDTMMTAFFNTELFGDFFPEVFRIGGPNFHPISFAYALAIFSAWLMFQNRYVMAILAVPLLLVIGSKGAMFLFIASILVRMGLRFLYLATVLRLYLALLALWISATLIVGIKGADYHTIGLMAGLRDFLHNPLGVGLGLGGSLSSAFATVDWGRAQQTGATAFPVESAIGVMFYQMGVGAFVFIGLLFGLGAKCLDIFKKTGAGIFMFSFVAITTLCANAILQEEAFYSPLTLGITLLFTGLSLGTYWRLPAYSSKIEK